MWRPASRDLALPASEVHLWRAGTALSEARARELAEVLSDAERARAGRFVLGRDGVRFVAARARLRMVLGRYLRLEPAAVRFSYGPFGRPELGAGIPNGGLRFSVSHSGDLALYAVVRHRAVGVDIERVRPVPYLGRLARLCFGPREAAACLSLPEGEREHAVLRGWTRLEAYLKGTGRGLGGAAGITRGEGARLAEVASRWSVVDLSPAPGYVGAVAVEGRGWVFRYLHEG